MRPLIVKVLMTTECDGIPWIMKLYIRHSKEAAKLIEREEDLAEFIREQEETLAIAKNKLIAARRKKLDFF